MSLNCSGVILSFIVYNITILIVMVLRSMLQSDIVFAHEVERGAALLGVNDDFEYLVHDAIGKSPREIGKGCASGTGSSSTRHCRGGAAADIDRVRMAWV
jgi:hypothetical protein